MSFRVRLSEITIGFQLTPHLLVVWADLKESMLGRRVFICNEEMVRFQNMYRSEKSNAFG